jgi:di/tricarboxylate transporter
MAKHAKRPRGEGGVVKEFLIGLLAVAWGGYNLLTQFNVIPSYFNTTDIQIVGNIIMVLAGFLLWHTAYRLWRVKWHTRGLF